MPAKIATNASAMFGSCEPGGGRMAWSLDREVCRVRDRAAKLCADCTTLNPSGGCLYGKGCMADRVFAMLDEDRPLEVWTPHDEDRCPN